jgi:hypothetical protein
MAEREVDAFNASMRREETTAAEREAISFIASLRCNIAAVELKEDVVAELEEVTTTSHEEAGTMGALVVPSEAVLHETAMAEANIVKMTVAEDNDDIDGLFDDDGDDTFDTFESTHREEDTWRIMSAEQEALSAILVLRRMPPGARLRRKHGGTTRRRWHRRQPRSTRRRRRGIAERRTSSPRTGHAGMPTWRRREDAGWIRRSVMRANAASMLGIAKKPSLPSGGDHHVGSSG